MSQFLDYASPLPRRRDIAMRIASTLPLSLGVIAYAFLCIPAALQRGYPPIDPVWTAVTYLWVFPVPLFVLRCPAGRFSKSALLLYAVVSGFVDGCTVVMMVPHRFSFIGGLGNSIFLIPVHLAGVGVIAWVSRFTISRFESFRENRNAPRQRAARVAISGAIILIAIGFPFAYRRAAIQRQERGGRARADADWTERTAVILSSDGWYSEHRFRDANIVSYFDVDSGLHFRSNMHQGFEDTYEKRIQELIRLHGAPSWSQKSRLVSDIDLVSMLTETTMKPVTSFPYDAAPGIVLIRNGYITRWGSSMGSGSNDLSIAAQFSGMNGYGNSIDMAYVGRLEKYPEVVFVRCGQKWVAACTDDGWILGYASRNWP